MIRFTDHKPQTANPDRASHGAAGLGPHVMDNVFLATLKSGYRALLAIKMSPGMFYLDFVIYPVLILVCLLLTFTAAPPPPALLSAGVVLSGYVAWTLVEYGLHRLVLHHLPRLEAIHHAHHDAPKDLIGTPTVVSVAAFIGLGFAPAVALIGLRGASAWMAGLLTGYLFYVLAHYAVHHFGTGRSRWLMKLKRHHALHHYRDGQSNFGVTTRIWDRVFGTLVR